MATIDLGRIKFKWQGAYNGATAYVVDDVVESGGASYVCIAATTGNTPPNATYWELMSQKGTDGIDADLLSISGTAQGDIYYNNGSAIARLAPGTNGQALLTGGTGANPSWGDVVSKVLSVSQNENNTRTVLSSTTSPTNLWTGTHTITKANSDLIISVTLHFHQSSAGNMGFRFIYDGTNYDGRIGHLYIGQPHQLVSHATFYIPNASSTTGSKNWNVQYFSANNSTNKPADTWNPNTSDDARTPQSVSSLIIQEIDN